MYLCQDGSFPWWVKGCTRKDGRVMATFPPCQCGRKNEAARYGDRRTAKEALMVDSEQVHDVDYYLHVLRRDISFLRTISLSPPLGEGRELWLEVEGGTAQSRCLTSRVGSRERMPTDVAAASAVRGPEDSSGGSAGGKEAEKRAPARTQAASRRPAADRRARRMKGSGSGHVSNRTLWETRQTWPEMQNTGPEGPAFRRFNQGRSFRRGRLFSRYRA